MPEKTQWLELTYILWFAERLLPSTRTRNLFSPDQPKATLTMKARCDFFKKYDLSAMYADPPSNTTVVVDAEQYVNRYTLQIHISYIHNVSLDVDSFNAVDAVVANVDVKYPPR